MCWIVFKHENAESRSIEVEVWVVQGAKEWIQARIQGEGKNEEWDGGKSWIGNDSHLNFSDEVYFLILDDYNSMPML